MKSHEVRISFIPRLGLDIIKSENFVYMIGYDPLKPGLCSSIHTWDGV